MATLKPREVLVTALFLATVCRNFVTYNSGADRLVVANTAPLLADMGVKKDDIVQTPSIRDWGCDLTETPLIFVHIGKSGGGSVRARLAASARNYSRQRWQNADDSYYPIGPNKTGFFCNIGHPNFRVQGPGTMERSFYCHATTPLGNAIACPEPLNWDHGQCKRCDHHSEQCHAVYTGHNLLGNELHWLPYKYLSKWWSNLFMENIATERTDPVQSLFETLAPDNPSWCPLLRKPRPADSITDEDYIACSAHLVQLADKEAFHAIQKKKSEYTLTSNVAANTIYHPHDIDWSSLYASMPLLRVTIIRDPYSWLVSKFVWHKLNSLGAHCDEVGTATSVVSAFEEEGQNGKGWLHRMAMTYLTYLCGEDCLNRESLGVSSIQQMEQQAANNLRRSFAVVGLFNETDTFYNMLSARVKYLDMSLNPLVKGRPHSTRNSTVYQSCKILYNDASFQANLRNRSAVFAALDRLYTIGVEVNRHQLRELQQCGGNF